jgi:hypothetical protein
LLCFVAALAPGGDFVGDALRADYDDFTDEFAALYEAILDGWGRRLRHPFTTRSVAVVIGALADGLTLRHLIDPGSVDLEAYQHTIVGMLVLVTAPTDDDRGVERLIEDVFPRPPRVE